VNRGRFATISPILNNAGLRSPSAKMKENPLGSMRTRVRFAVLTAGLVLVFQAGLHAAFPTATGYVTDVAEVLAGGDRDAAVARIREVEQKTSAEIAVATVTSLDGMSIEEYASTLFQRWGVGKKERDNGVLILLAPGARQIRIEVGYGLEPILPDGLAGEIIATEARPRFSNGEMSAGLLATIRRVADIVEANETVSAADRARLAAAANPSPPALLIIPLFGSFIAIGAFLFAGGLRSKTFFFVLFGAGFGGIPYLLSRLIFANAFDWILGPIGLAMLVVGWFKGRSPSWRSARGGGGASQSGWVMGADSPSSSSGSSSSSDSFGGGRSGGGGASGSW
jgi:uncharacterized protein